MSEKKEYTLEELQELNPYRVAVGCNLDPNDKRPNAPRRYFKRDPK